jgi:hypothetical protein
MKLQTLIKMSYYFYYIFFNAYWTSFDLGRTRVPRQNANYYVMLTSIFFLSGALLTLAGLGVFTFNPTWPFLIGIALIFFIEQLLLSPAIFERRLNEYEFIKDVPKGKRFALFFGILIFAGIFNVFGAFVFALN